MALRFPSFCSLMLSPQIPDSPIEAQVGGGDFCTGNTSDNDLCYEVMRADIEELLRGTASGLTYLEDRFVHMTSHSGITRLLDGDDHTPVPMVGASATLNSPGYVKFTVPTSANWGTEIKIPHVRHVRRYLAPEYWRFADTLQLLLHGLNCSTVETTSTSSAVESLFFSCNNAGEAGMCDNDFCYEVPSADRLEILQGNKESYVEFAVAASSKVGTEIKIGSHVIHVPKYLSVHRPLVQMILFACNMLDGTFACFKSMVPKIIFDMAKRLRASALSNWCKTGQSIVWGNELPENETHPSDTDASGAAWVAATAAPHHATGNRNLLAGFIIEHDDLFVHAVDGVRRRVLARGAVITDLVVLPDVWFVPGLTENLVSVSQLVELDHSVGFSCGKCCIRTTDGKVVGKGRLQDGGLYVLDFLKVPLAI